MEAACSTGLTTLTFDGLGSEMGLRLPEHMQGKGCSLTTYPEFLSLLEQQMHDPPQLTEGLQRDSLRGTGVVLRLHPENHCHH